ncbi:uncharacterized protein LOC116845257 isoform X1 [Odontomachus brunneus]|uniref:uncharacterized protein LOC116845257 isoform X1 n=1 Tax=Odontomachus brunneus TaxID=486640 RepID=UPI0013F24532|nr:uncharacterized protein LOC116845257 isoform X1 [Odontomachus brunneus]
MDTIREEQMHVAAIRYSRRRQPTDGEEQQFPEEYPDLRGSSRISNKFSAKHVTNEFRGNGPEGRDRAKRKRKREERVQHAYIRAERTMSQLSSSLSSPQPVVSSRIDYAALLVSHIREDDHREQCKHPEI